MKLNKLNKDKSSLKRSITKPIVVYDKDEDTANCDLLKRPPLPFGSHKKLFAKSKIPHLSLDHSETKLDRNGVENNLAKNFAESSLSGVRDMLHGTK